MSFTPAEARVQYNVLPRQSSTRLRLCTKPWGITFLSSFRQLYNITDQSKSQMKNHLLNR